MEVSGLQRGALGGQVVAGEHMVQIHADHGAVVGPAPSGTRHVPRVRAVPAGAMPRALGDLLGRGDELRAAADTLVSGAPIEVVGEPGTGRTAFLGHLARLRPVPEAGAVLFVRVAGQPGEDVLQALFESFYESDSAVVPTVSRLRSYLSDRRALVVLDDVDLARGEVERVMGMAPRCLFAIASGERKVWGRGSSLTLDGLDERSCLALAERELRRGLSDHERASLTRLSMALEGHPLRIVQAAHLMIDRRGTRSEGTAPGGSPREQFDELLIQSLAPHEAPLLGPLALFPGVALESRRIGHITGTPDALRLLASLEVRGLVRAHGSSYSLSGTVAGPIGSRVDASAWRARALEHYGRAGDLRADEAPAIVALLRAGAEAGDAGGVVRLARNADAKLALAARWGAWREALDLAFVAAREAGDTAGEAWALHQLGSRAGCLGDLRGAAGFLNDALRLREGLGDEDGATLTRHNMEALMEGRAAVGTGAEAPAPEAQPAQAAGSAPAAPPPAAEAPAAPTPAAEAPAAPTPAAEAPVASEPAAPPDAPAPWRTGPTSPPPASAPPPGSAPPPSTPAPPARTGEPLWAPPPTAGPPPAAAPPSAVQHAGAAPQPPAESAAPPPGGPPAPPGPPPLRHPPSRQAPEPSSGRGISRPSLPDLSGVSLPPLKPVIAAVAAVAFVVLLVMLVSGGDDESSTGDKAETIPGAGAAPGGRGGRGGRRARPAPALPAVIEPRELRFTARPVRLSKPLSVDVRNSGGARIRIGGVRVEGPNRRDFAVTNGCVRASLSNGGRCKVVVSFLPARRGAPTRTAVLIFLNDGRGGRQTVSLNGTVLPP